MDNREVIEQLNSFYEMDEMYAAAQYAIQAIEEREQYRAIGTLEELQTAMKYVSLAKKHGTVGKVIDVCAEYEAIGTLEEVKQAVERMKPKKPITYDISNIADCPKCGAMVRGIFKPFGDWCSKCGQYLDWTEGE